MRNDIPKGLTLFKTFNVELTKGQIEWIVLQVKDSVELYKNPMFTRKTKEFIEYLESVIND